MKNRLLFTTALIAAAFAVSDARAERLVVSSGEEEAVNAEMSASPILLQPRFWQYLQ